MSDTQKLSEHVTGMFAAIGDMAITDAIIVMAELSAQMTASLVVACSDLEADLQPKTYTALAADMQLCIGGVAEEAIAALPEADAAALRHVTGIAIRHMQAMFNELRLDSEQLGDGSVM